MCGFSLHVNHQSVSYWCSTGSRLFHPVNLLRTEFSENWAVGAVRWKNTVEEREEGEEERQVEYIQTTWLSLSLSLSKWLDICLFLVVCICLSVSVELCVQSNTKHTLAVYWTIKHASVSLGVFCFPSFNNLHGVSERRMGGGGARSKQKEEAKRKWNNWCA